MRACVRKQEAGGGGCEGEGVKGKGRMADNAGFLSDYYAFPTKKKSISVQEVQLEPTTRTNIM